MMPCLRTRLPPIGLWLAALFLTVGCAASAANPDAGPRDSSVEMDAAAIDAGGDVMLGDTSGDAIMPPVDVFDGGPNWLYQVPECAAENIAPLRNGTLNEVACVRVGARIEAALTEWPDVSLADSPIVFVRPGAVAGDGSQDRPYGTLAEALAPAIGARTIVLSTGTHTVSSTLTVDRPVTFIGVGAGTTGSSIVEFTTADAAAFKTQGSGFLTLLHLAIASPVPVSATGVELGVGTSADLRDVRVQNLARGVLADGATLHVDGLTVRGASDGAVRLRATTEAELKSVLVLEGGRVGVGAYDSHLAFSEGLIRGVSGVGLVLAGRSPGVPDQIDHVSVLRSVGAGIVVTGADRESTLALVMGSGTRAAAGVTGADGLVVRDGASVVLDPTIRNDARRGMGSAFVQNDRFGAFASGADTWLEFRGALVGSNVEAGLLLQQSARSPVVGFSYFHDNRAIGAAATSQSWVMGFQCNGYVATREGPMPFPGVTAEIGVGLIVAPGEMTPPLCNVEGSLFDNNASFAALLLGANVRLMNNLGVRLPGTIGTRDTMPIGDLTGVGETNRTDLPSGREVVGVPEVPMP